jgi:selenocysteine lyase/cysteine desulfurase
MILNCQKDSFSLPEGIHFLNNATFSPMSKAAEAAGHEAIRKIAAPIGLKANDFFDDAQSVRVDFSTLINAQDPDRIALVPSASYALSTVAANLHRKPNLKAGDEILILNDEFPNDFYCFERVAKNLNLCIKTIEKPAGTKIGKKWNEQILASISAKTALVVVSHIHWIYGTVFDIQAIADQCKSVGALLVIDGTQSIGAIPFDIQQIKPDALFAGSYKSLFGAYQVGFAYYGAFFDEGIPIEESWMNRLDSHLFHKLIDYQKLYRPKAQRYNVGEFSNFNSLPISGTAIKEILAWQPARIQAYCKSLVEPFVTDIEAMGFELENEEYRSFHLFSIGLKPTIDAMKIQEILTKKQVIVAVRGNSIRVSPSIYNDASDIEALIEALREALTI